jgi:hypothetical protein
MTGALSRLRAAFVERARPLVPFAVLLLMLSAMLLAPLLAIGKGYRPMDDALRHCGKALSGRPWTEILVLGPAYTLDHHQGWHVLLEALHGVGFTAPGLLTVSVVGLFLVALALPLFLLPRAEYWLVALAVLLFVWPDASARFLLGRPYLIQTAVTLLICLRWEDFERPRLPWGLAWTLLLLTAWSAWCRSTWYLYPLPPLFLWLAGRRRSGWLTLGICMAGVLIGACLTGHPWGYFRESTQHLLDATQRGVPSWLLVTEFQPRAPGLQGIILVGGLLLWRGVKGLPLRAAVVDPSFFLLLGSALLGFHSVRFALDFGMPALLAWMTRQIEVLAGSAPALRDERGWPRLGLALGAALVFGASATADLGARYSSGIGVKTLCAETDGEWLPGAGGILYSTSMRIFFDTFYENPKAPWRYVLGFEPGMMTAANREVYEGIAQSDNDARFYRPWVLAMRPEDRLILEAGKESPSVPGLEWHNVRGGLWSGRLTTAPSAPAEGSVEVDPGD